jgi:CRP-like cAMP-binding protein
MDQNAGDRRHLAKLQNYFYENGFRMTIPRRNIIVFQGDEINDLFFVSRGIYKIYNIDSLGEERTISIAGRNNILPLSWPVTLRTKQHRALYFHEAYTELVVYRVKQEEFRSMLKVNMDLAYYLLESSTRANISLESRVQNLQKSKVDEKAEFILYFLARRLGCSLDGRIFEIKKSITQQDIADLAGVTRETASRFLLKAQLDKVAWKADSNFYIDITKLDLSNTAPVYS